MSTTEAVAFRFGHDEIPDWARKRLDDDSLLLLGKKQIAVNESAPCFWPEGSWVVSDDSGVLHVMDDATFRDLYRPIVSPNFKELYEKWRKRTSSPTCENAFRVGVKKGMEWMRRLEIKCSLGS